MKTFLMLSLFALSGGSWLLYGPQTLPEEIHFARAEAQSGLVKTFFPTSSEVDPSALTLFINEDGRSSEVSFAMSEEIEGLVASGKEIRYKAASGTKLSGAGFLVSKRFIGEHSLDFRDSSALAQITYEDSLMVIDRIAREKQREVKEVSLKLSWPGGSLWLVEFERELQNALVSLVVFSTDGLSFFDMPANTHNVKNVWQRGDNGVFDLESFKPFVLIRRGKEMHFAVVWHRFDADRMLLLKREGTQMRVIAQDDL